MIIIIDNTISDRDTYKDKIIEQLETYKYLYSIVDTQASLQRALKNNPQCIISSGSQQDIPTMNTQTRKINTKALKSGIPYIGICFGAQFLNWWHCGNIDCSSYIKGYRSIMFSCGTRKHFWFNKHCFITQTPLYVIAKRLKTCEPVVIQDTKKHMGVLFHPEYTNDIVPLLQQWLISQDAYDMLKIY